MTTYFYTASSLDGFIATEEDSLEWLFKQDFDEEGPMAYPAFVEKIGALIMGANTYEWLLENGGERPYEQPTWVLTHRELGTPEGSDVRFSQDAGLAHEQAVGAAQGQGVWIVGGGGLAGEYARAGLLDEVWVQFAPVTLGSGKPLLPVAVDLELVDVARNRHFVCTRYRVVKPGTIDQGSK